MWELLASVVKLLVALATLGCGLYLGWQLEPDKDPAARVPYILGVMLATVFPIGFILYVKFWESWPDFSTACGKQAMIGLACFICLSLLARAFPYPVEKW